jgi:predicted  nucleic acid-binding Zn-ribbon protein
MNPNANPFIPKKPIDIANDEIRNLKREIVKLRSEITTLKTHISPMREDYLKRKADEEESDKEIVVVNNSWFW